MSNTITKKITALVFIFVSTCIAWMILGTAIKTRTMSYDQRLKGEVGDLWGTSEYQFAPECNYSYEVEKEITDKDNKTIKRKETIRGRLPISGSDIDVGLSLEYRKKGLLWYSTYLVNFDGSYTLVNDMDTTLNVYFLHKFSSGETQYDDFHIFLDDNEVEDLKWGDMGVGATTTLPPGKSVRFRVVYRSRGQDEWTYYFGDGSTMEVRDFVMSVNTDFTEVDFPSGSVSPTKKEETSGGMILTWEYAKQITSKHISILLPKKLNPGPLVGKITFFAPVSLFFFFFILFMITTIREIKIHPMNFFFLACAFFSFHLLFSYLVDHLSINISFGISSVVSLFLVVSYLRLVVGMRFACVEAGVSQLVYLILFSYSFFFKGYTGLIITIASIITLFIFMQMTGRIDWGEKFATVELKKGENKGTRKSI